MLPVDQGLAFPGFSGLEEKRVAAPSFREPVEREHPPERETALLAAGRLSHDHDPVRRVELAAAPRSRPESVLARVTEKSAAVDHEGPRSRRRVPGEDRRGIGLPARPRPFPRHGQAREEGARSSSSDAISMCPACWAVSAGENATAARVATKSGAGRSVPAIAPCFNPLTIRPLKNPQCPLRWGTGI